MRQGDKAVSFRWPPQFLLIFNHFPDRKSRGDPWKIFDPLDPLGTWTNKACLYHTTTLGMWPVHSSVVKHLPPIRATCPKHFGIFRSTPSLIFSLTPSLRLSSSFFTQFNSVTPLILLRKLMSCLAPVPLCQLHKFIHQRICAKLGEAGGWWPPPQ